jgi:hypothetical protein
MLPRLVGGNNDKTPVDPRIGICKKWIRRDVQATCFIDAMDRKPAIDAPIAASIATFSFGAHSDLTSLRSAMFSKISVLGVPG